MEEKVVLNLKLENILPNRFQPRIKFNEEAIIELSESIKEHGVIQPIIVREIGNKYEIIAGERRYKASVMAGKETIPAIVNNLNDKNSAEIALIENVQRQDLTPIEEAVSYKKILDMGYLTQEELAAKIDKKQSTISNKLRLLNLADEVQESLLNEEISERHARSLLKLEKYSDQVLLLERIIKERLTVRKTDIEIKKILDESGDKKMLDNNTEEELVNENYIKEIPKFTINIPTDPILNDSIDDLEVFDFIDLKEVEQKSFNPGFLDIDLIEKEAKDLNPKEEKNYDIEELLRGTANSKDTEEKIALNSFNSGKFFTSAAEQINESEKLDFNFDFTEFDENQQIMNSDYENVLNSIDECKNHLEKLGFTIRTERIEENDHYKVTFIIDKKNI